jgi:xanthine dehydrogenase/oxidase
LDLLKVVSHINPTTKKLYHASVNACLAPVVSVDGKHVVTVEGIGDVKKPHPAQQRIAVANGSQCGFCTPGIVMVRRYHESWRMGDRS